jgi:transketolase
MPKEQLMNLRGGFLKLSNSITQRDAFWNKVYELGKEDRNIIVVSADMGAPALDKFRRDLSSQFVNVGISEQNGILISTGLTLAGKKVFVYAIAPFITLRCLEQIRVNNAMMNIPITIVGVGGGFGYDDSGPTHHLTEDIAIMRSLPNIEINSITDSIMAASFAEISYNKKNTNYIRLDRKILPNIYNENTDFSAGLSVLKEGSFYIVATGCMVHIALEVANSLREKSINIGVIDVFRIPIPEENFIKSVRNTKKIITLEEHFFPGGFGSAICEILMDNGLIIPTKRIGLSHSKGYCYEYGGREIIWQYYGIDKKSIISVIEQFLKEKS